MQNSQFYFDDIAPEYDYWKQKNWYYHWNLKKLYRSFIPEGSTVLEIGCGTGDLLAATQPQEGLGIDISPKMIAIARQRHASKNNLSFESLDILKRQQPFLHDYVFMADVLEHIENLPDFIAHLGKLLKPGTELIVSVANPLWEPVLMLAEKLKIKMPEGPHWRLSTKENEVIFKKSEFVIKEKNYRLLIPKSIPASEWVNERFYKFPLLRNFGFVVFWRLKKNQNQN